MKTYQIKAITYYRNKPSVVHNETIQALSEDDAKFRFTQLQQNDPFWHSTKIESVTENEPEIISFLKGFRK